MIQEKAKGMAMKFVWTFAAMVFGSFSLVGFAQNYPSQKKEPAFGVDFSLEYLDAYFFRGKVVDIEPGMNANLTLGVGKVTYSYFSHQENGSSDQSFKEQNHAVEMTWLMNSAVQTMGYRYYDFDSLMPDTQELFYRIAYQTPWHLTFGTFMDIDAYKGYYFDLSGDRMIPVSRKGVLGLKLYIAGAKGLTQKGERTGTIFEYGYFGDDGLTNGYAKLYYRWYPSQRWTLEAAFRYYHAFDDLLDADPLTKDNRNVMSFKLRYVFP